MPCFTIHNSGGTKIESANSVKDTKIFAPYLGRINKLTLTGQPNMRGTISKAIDIISEIGAKLF